MGQARTAAHAGRRGPARLLPGRPSGTAGRPRAGTHLDDGDGAPRDELVPAVADATGASESEVEDAIQGLLMSGQCYEPDDDRFKPI